MSLGAFSISLAVKDLPASRRFYEALGFAVVAGDGEHYLVLKCGDAIVGLFHGMFEGNILTFNPGWDQSASELAEFEDVHAIQARLRAAGLELVQDTDPDGTGRAAITLVDPDGNAVLIDQHVVRAGA